MRTAYRPWLIRSHPNFALIFLATALFHVGCAVILWVEPEVMFNPALARTLEAAEPRTWGLLHMVVFLLMIVGLFMPRFTVARAGLAIGLALSLVRAMLLLIAWMSDGAAVGLSVPVWFLIALLHASQVAEPPINPATRRD